MTCMVSSRPKQGTRPVLNFLGASIILFSKKCISRGLHWLNNVAGVYLFKCFLDSYVSRVWEISLGIGPWLPVGWRIVQSLHQRRRKMTMNQPLLLQHKQQANPLLSMHNYTTLVISGNYKNKQPTLSSHCKLALTARNTHFAS
jgi:hypothetical protein